MDGPERLRVSQPKPFVYMCSEATLALKTHTRKTPHLRWGSNLPFIDCRSKPFANWAILIPNALYEQSLLCVKDYWFDCRLSLGLFKSSTISYITIHTCVYSKQHRHSVVGLLAVHRLCGVIEGRLSHFLPRWLRTGWQSAISQGKNPLKYSAVAGNRTRATGRTDSELFHWAIMTD